MSAVPTPTGIAILTILSGILIALIRGYFEMRKAREEQAKVIHEVQPNSGGSMRDVVSRIESAVSRLDDKVDTQGERLVRVETLISERGRRVE